MTSTEHLTRWVGAAALPYVEQAGDNADPDPADLPLWGRSAH